MAVERCSNYNRCNIPRALFSRADELKRQYTGAICGLGFDVDTDESIYSEHDMELTFDTLISQDDLKMVLPCFWPLLSVITL